VKMEFLFSGLFWGLLLILIGLIVVINIVFKIEIPVARIIFGLLFVYIGLHILFGGGKKKEAAVIFAGSEEWSTSVQDKYDTIFGSRKVDLSSIDLAQGSVKIKVDTIFGNCELRIDPAMPVKIHASAVFGSVQLPNGKQVVFGDDVYVTPGYKENVNTLNIKLDTVFGNTKITEDKPAKPE